MFAQIAGIPPQFLPLLFLALWLVVSFLIAVFGGWRQLSRSYRASSDFMGERWRFRSISMRWATGYNNVITIGADPTGLYLSVFFLFRFGHPPLFLPWTELSALRSRHFFVRVVTLSASRHPEVPIRVPARLFTKIAASLGAQLPAHLAT